MIKSKLHGLYAITDATLMAHNFADAVESTLQGGSRIIQYRDKSNDTDKRLQQALTIRRLCDQYRALFIINDDIELALSSNADGVHLGKDDQHIKVAREQLGERKIIGVSCYNQLQLAIDAEQAGADYVAFGAFFSSSIKPDASNAPLSLIRQAKAQIKVPVCCIGGITALNGGELIAAGSDMLAVISDIFKPVNEVQNIELSSRCISQLFS
ncbi:MAG: thiamine phosphate synthase [Gammaproteobacteria bacterium]|nr:thiamine phosphate synthase [Gammaproteobacteria bacterium]